MVGDGPARRGAGPELPEDGGGLSLEWFLARRYLAGERGSRYGALISLIAIGGVVVGVMALVVVIGVMTGLQTDLREKILGASAHGMVLEVGQEIRMEGWREILDEVRGRRHVSAVAPFIYTEVGLHAGGSYSEGAVLRGIAPDSAALAVTKVDEHLTAGEMPFGRPDSLRPGILVGTRLADRLGLYPGDAVTVVSFQNVPLTPTGITPKLRRFEVTGIFETGLFQYDDKFTYVPLEAAQDFFGMGGAVTGVEFNVDDPWQARRIADEMAADLGFPYQVSSWQEQNQSLFSALNLEKMAMGVILLLIVLVASFNIVSTLVMMVAEKTREIGILRSMGLTESSVMRVFMYMGVAIGVVGTVVGMGLGAGVGWLLERYPISIPGDVYFVSQLPVLLDPLDLGIIATASFLISFLATLYPARRAAELAPVEAIRYE